MTSSSIFITLEGSSIAMKRSSSCWFRPSFIYSKFSSHCLLSLLLVLNQPRSQSPFLSDWACPPVEASSWSDCGGVLANLRCLPSSGEDCRFTTVWSNRCWHCQSKSLMDANTGTSGGSSNIGSTSCTRMLATALACLV